MEGGGKGKGEGWKEKEKDKKGSGTLVKASVLVPDFRTVWDIIEERAVS